MDQPSKIIVGVQLDSGTLHGWKYYNGIFQNLLFYAKEENIKIQKIDTVSPAKFS